MSDTTTFHIVRRRDVSGAGPLGHWDDPANFARPSPSKLRALVENPVAGDDAEPVQIIATRDGRAVGRIDLIPANLRVGGTTTKVYWGSDLYVPPEHRNTLTGLMLILKAQAMHHTVGAFGPSQAALPIYQKLKWSDLPIPRHILIVRSRSVIARYVGRGILARVARALADAALFAHRALVLRPWSAIAARGLRVERVERMPADLNDPLSGANGRADGVAVVRSAEMINWWLSHFFRDDPRNANDLFLVRDAAGTVVAYFINKVRFHPTATHRGFKNVLLGSLQDWMIFVEGAISLKQLLLISVRALVRRNVDAIEFCCGDPSGAVAAEVDGFPTRRLAAPHDEVDAPQPAGVGGGVFGPVALVGASRRRG